MGRGGCVVTGGCVGRGGRYQVWGGHRASPLPGVLICGP